ncbi:MAG: hypothetical protein IKF14_06950 [Atopobiaceae bacterium]|nr:hypothetical protein [Atopobiaceae bacterium]
MLGRVQTEVIVAGRPEQGTGFSFHAGRGTKNPSPVPAGYAGTITTCFLQMFYVVFLFPFVMARFGNDAESDTVAKSRPKHARPSGELPSGARF